MTRFVLQEIEQLRLRWIVAGVLLVISTLPVFAIFSDVLTQFTHQSLIVRVFASPNAPAAYATYLALIVSSLMGASYLSSLKRSQGETVYVTQSGLAVFCYTGLVVLIGVPTIILLSDADEFQDLSNASSAPGAAQMLSYVSWAVSTCATMALSILGIATTKSDAK